MQIGVIADIHGNALALEAVLADMRPRSLDRIINLGDLVSGPLLPRETMELLAGLDVLTVRGNHDRWVSRDDPTRMGASDQFAHAQLRPEQRSWLGALPMFADAGQGIVSFHATPNNDNRYLVEKVNQGRLERDSVANIRERLGELDARVVLCGHSHRRQLLQLPNGPLILNPGSVGCPAYDDPGHDAHVSEAGSPHARYAVLTLKGDGVAVEMIAVQYPWEDAARCADRNGRPDWAHALRTGWMPGSI